MALKPWQIAFDAWEDSPDEYGETLYGPPAERAFRAAYEAAVKASQDELTILRQQLRVAQEALALLQTEESNGSSK